MKILFLKNPILKFLSICIVIISIICITTLVLTKKNSNNEDNNIQIQVVDPDECECGESAKFKENDEFLKEEYINKKLVALTFDDGPSEYTTTLVDELKKRNITATFFVLGSEVSKFPDSLKFAYEAGNEIAIHSYEHKIFTKLSYDEITSQVSRSKNLIYEITKEYPKLIRVPYGALNKSIKNILSENDLTSVLWHVDSLDWKFKNTANTYNYVIKKFKGNDVILMHDSFKTSVEAATLIMDTLQSKCYTFVTVSEYLKIRTEVKGK